jgi:hypothetical protein
MCGLSVTKKTARFADSRTPRSNQRVRGKRVRLFALRLRRRRDFVGPRPARAYAGPPTVCIRRGRTSLQIRGFV